ncbi:GTPase [Novispirillum sp. DQ9]|uniref:GTPase n=1 Tax=Novispirillum sp. DQ9 TaxID=3398612 RepID=UPI003C7A0C00
MLSISARRSAGEGRTAQLARLARHLPEGDPLAAQLLQLLDPEEEPLRVTVCGLFNAGKSSLLNSLTDQLETFATGAARTTRAAQSLRHQGFLFVDTPGLDADEEDDREAWEALAQADVLLFLHDPGTGELHQQEVDFLSGLATLPGTRGSLPDRLVLVLSRLEQHEHCIDILSETISAQVAGIFGVLPATFHISNTRYQKGVREGEEIFIERSGIPALRNYLYGEIRSREEDLRESRLRGASEAATERLNEMITEKENRLRQLEAEIRSSLDDLRSDVGAAITLIHKKFSSYNPS